MALTATTTEPIRAQEFFGWWIKMQANGQDVRVLVQDEALQNIASTSDDSFRKMSECRAQVEAIASRKYAAGKINSDGSVTVTSADVAS